MLKFIFLMLISLPSFACTVLHIEGNLSVDGQTWKFDRKMRGLGKEDSIPVGPYILSMTLTHPDKAYLVRYKVEEKKGTTLAMITKGEEEDVEMNKSREIFARGETGQPNSIITIKLKDI